MLLIADAEYPKTCFLSKEVGTQISYIGLFRVFPSSSSSSLSSSKLTPASALFTAVWSNEEPAMSGAALLYDGGGGATACCWMPSVAAHSDFIVIRLVDCNMLCDMDDREAPIADMTALLNIAILCV